jgi:multidrug efflux pump subunit AcrA (membrane-fusion protein)
VSVGDYVTKGAKVAVVVRVDPLRVELTVPTPFIAAIGVGQSVDFEVDAYPGRTFRGQVKYVSPALEASQRALTVEAIVANPRSELKPGLFATARIEQSAKTPGVPYLRRSADHGGDEPRLRGRGRPGGRTAGDYRQTLDGRVEVTKGLKGGEHVATANIGLLVDGRKVTGTDPCMACRTLRAPSGLRDGAHPR